MIRGDRILELLHARGLSQGELARRVGVKQPSIFKLIHDNKSGSRHLHRIACELGTTSAYLTGETDDPDSDLPDDAMTSEEREWVDLLRALEPKERQAALTLVRTIATSARSPTIHDKGQGYKSAREAALS